MGAGLAQSLVMVFNFLKAWVDSAWRVLILQGGRWFCMEGMEGNGAPEPDGGWKGVLERPQVLNGAPRVSSVDLRLIFGLAWECCRLERCHPGHPWFCTSWLPWWLNTRFSVCPAPAWWQAQRRCLWCCSPARCSMLYACTPFPGT